MRYFVKKTRPSKKGLYLQIYRTNYVPGLGNRNKSYQVVGYYDDLVKQGIEDPIKYAQGIADSLNEGSDSKKARQIGDVSSSQNVGYFLIKAMIDRLGVDRILNIFTSKKQFGFKMSDFLRAMIYAQIANPGSKLKAFENVIPSLYGVDGFSYDQILDGIEYIGMDYQKYIELFNVKINEQFGRDASISFFDCTNYYFEIDLEDSLRQKGPSKEERRLPLIGQALLLDKEQIPLGMMLYPGNESEKPYLRKVIEDTKARFDISGKTVQVADKGLNCARNIYAAAKEANDGYIFSKSVHGRNLSGAERKWVLLDNEQNRWAEVKDDNGATLYKYKSCIDTFGYSFISEEGEEVKFTVKEKRIVTYNPSLARKQRLEIAKQVEKARSCVSIKSLAREEYGDMSKYINFTATTKDGKKAKIASSLNNEKIEEDMSFAGYNLIVTSELDMPEERVYEVYHGLWRIEECFRVMKSYLEARPVYLQKEDSIYGHFTICYLALTILRLLEIKVFEDKIPLGRLVEFIRQYSVTDTGEGTYINNAIRSKTFLEIKERLGLSKLGNLTLKKRDIDLLLNTII